MVMLKEKSLETLIEWIDYDNTVSNNVFRKRSIISSDEPMESIQLVPSVASTQITNEVITNLLYRLFSYNEKLNVDTIPLNWLGYELVKNNYENGCKRIEFKKIVIPFISNYLLNNSNNHINQLTESDFNKHCSTFYNMNIFLKSRAVN